MECPICHQNTKQKISLELGVLISRHEIISELVNPAGRDLIFKYGGRIHLSDKCDSCDQKKLYAFFRSADII